MVERKYDLEENKDFLMFLQEEQNGIYMLIPDPDNYAYRIIGNKLWQFGGFDDYYPWDGQSTNYIETILRKLEEIE